MDIGSRLTLLEHTVRGAREFHAFGDHYREMAKAASPVILATAGQAKSIDEGKPTQTGLAPSEGFLQMAEAADEQMIKNFMQSLGHLQHLILDLKKRFPKAKWPAEVKPGG